MPKPGEVIEFQGDKWVAVSYDAMRDSWTLRSTTRTTSGALRWFSSGVAGYMAADLGGRMPVETEATTEALMNDAHDFKADTWERVQQRLKDAGIDPDAPGNEAAARFGSSISEVFEKMMGTFSFDASGFAMRGYMGLPEHPNARCVVTGEQSYEDWCDRKWEDPQLTGWYVIIEEPPPEETEFLVFAPERKAHAVTDLAEAWLQVDFCIDEELGVPMAIKKDERVIYINDDGWQLVRPDYPPVSQWL